MIITAIKTKIISVGDSLERILDQSFDELGDRTILAVTSKIVALCEGNVLDSAEISKRELIKKEADYYFASDSPYMLTIKDSVLIPASGIDESNGDGKFVLWPKDPYASARGVRDYLANKFHLANLGVIITDSKTSPLRWGTTGIAIGYAGFRALKDYRDTEDIFGEKLKVTLSNHLDALAAAAVLVMGEGNEQTPMALIQDGDFIKFDGSSPTKEDMAALKIDRKDDLYGSLLNAVPWKKGKSGLK